MRQRSSYETPVSEIIRLNNADVITTSGAGGGKPDKWPNGKPGNGLGDNNHDHVGPPGQNKK